MVQFTAVRLLGRDRGISHGDGENDVIQSAKGLQLVQLHNEVWCAFNWVSTEKRFLLSEVLSAVDVENSVIIGNLFLSPELIKKG
jgi:hypothetical protein